LSAFVPGFSFAVTRTDKSLAQELRAAPRAVAQATEALAL